MRHNEIEEFIGVDVGTVRIGLARGNSAARLAEPLKTLAADQAVQHLSEIAGQLQATGVVVGLPRGLDGQETPQTEYVRRWADAARERIDLPFYWQDEALTTQAAQNGFDKAGIDARAAAIILQDFLDTPEDQRVRCVK